MIHYRIRMYLPRQLQTLFPRLFPGIKGWGVPLFSTCSLTPVSVPDAESLARMLQGIKAFYLAEKRFEFVVYFRMCGVGDLAFSHLYDFV